MCTFEVDVHDGKEMGRKDIISYIPEKKSFPIWKLKKRKRCLRTDSLTEWNSRAGRCGVPLEIILKPYSWCTIPPKTDSFTTAQSIRDPVHVLGHFGRTEVQGGKKSNGK